MREGDSLTLNQERLPRHVHVGQEFDIRVRGRVRRIEAEHVDVTGYSGGTAMSVLEGSVFVELTVLDVGVEEPC